MIWVVVLSTKKVQLCKPTLNVETHAAEFRYPVENYMTLPSAVWTLLGHHLGWLFVHAAACEEFNFSKWSRPNYWVKFYISFTTWCLLWCMLDGGKSRSSQWGMVRIDGQSQCKKNTQHFSVIVPREMTFFLSWWFINKVITLIERTVPFKSLFTCQIIKLANRESVPGQICKLFISQWIIFRLKGY